MIAEKYAMAIFDADMIRYLINHSYRSIQYFNYSIYQHQCMSAFGIYQTWTISVESIYQPIASKVRVNHYLKCYRHLSPFTDEATDIRHTRKRVAIGNHLTLVLGKIIVSHLSVRSVKSVFFPKLRVLGLVLEARDFIEQAKICLTLIRLEVFANDLDQLLSLLCQLSACIVHHFSSVATQVWAHTAVDWVD